MFAGGKPESEGGLAFSTFLPNWWTDEEAEALTAEEVLRNKALGMAFMFGADVSELMKKKEE